MSFDAIGSDCQSAALGRGAVGLSVSVAAGVLPSDDLTLQVADQGVKGHGKPIGVDCYTSPKGEKSLRNRRFSGDSRERARAARDFGGCLRGVFGAVAMGQIPQGEADAREQGLQISRMRQRRGWVGPIPESSTEDSPTRVSKGEAS